MNTKRRKTGARLGAILLSLCLIVGLLPVTAFAADDPIKRNTYHVYSDEAIAGGADSQVYAVTIENVDGADLHYVYSENAIHVNALMEEIRKGLDEPYKSLIPIFKEDDYFHLGFLCFSRDQDKYEEMELDWSNPQTVADALIPKEGSVSVVHNVAAVSVTDISQLHAGEEVVSTKQLSAGDFYTNPPELGQLEIGKNRVETIHGYTTLIEEAKYFDIFQHMHVTQISAFTARKHPVTRDTYFKSYTDASLNGGSDSQVYAATIRDENGDFTLHYVYSPNAIHSNDLMDQIRAGLADPYKSLIPKFAQDDLSKQGFLCFSNDPEKYESMDLDWADVEAVAAALIPGEGTVTCAMGDDAVSVTDISEIDHEEAIIIEEGFCDPDLDVPLLVVDGELEGSNGDVYEEIDLHPGKNRVEASIETFEIEIFEIVDSILTKVIPTDYHVMHVTQISAFTATKEEEGTAPTKRDTYNVYAENVINGGADSQVYANTVTVKRDGYDGDEILVLHYVYSPNAIHSNELMEKIRAGLSEPYKSLVPTFEEGDSNRGFLRVSQDQEKYESMDLDWGNVAATAAALTPNRVSSLSTHNNSDTAISVTDISEIHSGEKVVSKDQLSMEDFYEHLSELGKLGIGKNRVEVITSVSIRTETVEDKAHYDVFNTMHVAQIYAQGAVSVDKITPASDPITLPVRVLEEGDTDYSPAPELSAAFTPDTAVAVGEFNEFQGLAIDYYYPMVDAELSEGYDIQAGYTVSIPLTGYAGETLSGTLTIPLPQGYDGATARIKGGASASSYTATTVTFPLTLDVSGGTAEAFELLIEYKEAQEPVQPPVIIAGANGSWQKSGTDGLSFTSNAAFADFIKVQVDGKDLDASNYTVKEGSTIVTLNAAYLNTLSVGKHTLSIVSANGTATTEFTITAAPTGGDQTEGNQTGGDNQTGGTTPQEPDKNGGDTTIPQTGDSSNAVLWIALLFASGVGLMGAAVYSRKKDTANNQ